MRYIDAFCHFSPKRYFDALIESPAGQKDIGKRVRGIPALYDLDLRLKVVDQFPDYTQVLSLGLPMVDRLWGPDKTPEMAKLAGAIFGYLTGLLTPVVMSFFKGDTP